MVKTIPFGDIEIASPGFGAMGLNFGLGQNLSLEQAEPVLLKAIELGCTFWDTAVGLKYLWSCVGTLLNENSGCLRSGDQRETARRLH